MNKLTISRKEYASLLESEAVLDLLRDMGVEYWKWYWDAIDEEEIDRRVSSGLDGAAKSCNE